MLLVFCFFWGGDSSGIDVLVWFLFGSSGIDFIVVVFYVSSGLKRNHVYCCCFFRGLKRTRCYCCCFFSGGLSVFFCFFPEALRRVLLLKAAANFTCQLLMPTCRELLHLPTSHANLSRVTSPANFSCQLVESYFTCQLLMPTCRELLHLPTSHVNFSAVISFY